MKKKTVAIVLAILALLAAGIYGGVRYFQETYLVMHETAYKRDTDQLDLSGIKNPDVEQICQLSALKSLDVRDTELTVAQYEQLRKALPHCEILWQVPFQGKYQEPDTGILTVADLKPEELELLKYFPELREIQWEDCADPEVILALREKYPDVELTYRMEIGGRKAAHTTVKLMLANPDPQEVGRLLPCLPQVEYVTLTGDISDPEGVRQLEEDYPDIAFLWNMEIAGKKFLNTSRELDFTGIQVEDLEEIADAYRYFPNLELVNLSHCGKSYEELDAYWKRHPEIRVVWTVKIQFFEVRTDITYLMPYQYGCGKLSNKDVDSLKYLVDLVCVDFGHMGLTDLSFLEYTPNIEYLIIADSHVRDISPVANLKKLKYLEIFMNQIRDISALAECPELRDVNMCYNNVIDISPLLELEHLEHAWLKGNHVYWDSYEKLKEKFPDAKIVLYSENPSSTGDGWREIPRYYEQRDYLGMWYMVG